MDDQPAAERTMRSDRQDVYEPRTQSIFTARRRSVITTLATRVASPGDERDAENVAARQGLVTRAGSDIEDTRHGSSWPLDAPYEPLCAAVQCTVVEPAGAPVAATDDAPLLAILEGPLLAGEPASVGFARKERLLRDAFAQLPLLAARALQKRLANPGNGDRLAEKFRGLTAERQQRLLKSLADARRRAALSGQR